MAYFNLLFNTGRLDTPIVAPKLQTAVNLRNLAQQLESGMLDSISLIARATPVKAVNTIVCDGTTGTVGATVNGVTNNVTAAVSDDVATAALIAAAINANSNALVSGLVTATSAAGLTTTGVVTITAVDPGKSGNAITTAAVGTGVTATGARLISGTNGTQTTFEY